MRSMRDGLFPWFCDLVTASGPVTEWAKAMFNLSSLSFSQVLKSHNIFRDCDKLIESFSQQHHCHSVNSIISTDDETREDAKWKQQTSARVRTCWHHSTRSRSRSRSRNIYFSNTWTTNTWWPGPEPTVTWPGLSRQRIDRIDYDCTFWNALNAVILWYPAHHALKSQWVTPVCPINRWHRLPVALSRISFRGRLSSTSRLLWHWAFIE
jgi:hypothetical protein